MKINFYTRSCPFQSRLDALQHLAEGILKMDKNIEIGYINDFTFQYADLSVIWGMPKPFQIEGKLSRARCSIVAGAQFTQTPLLILDMPIFGRKQNVRIDEPEDSYRILEGHALGYGKYPTSDTNRWSKIAKKYKIKLKKQVELGIIGIASQRQIDADMFGVNIVDWIFNSIKTLREYTSEQIGIKLHPKDIVDNRELYNNRILTKFNNVSLIDNINICKSLITYTSNISIDALVAGIPVISCHPANFLYSYSSNNILDAINPSLDNRLDTLKKLSYIQWSNAEMYSGLTWRHIRKII